MKKIILLNLLIFGCLISYLSYAYYGTSSKIGEGIFLKNYKLKNYTIIGIDLNKSNISFGGIDYSQKKDDNFSIYKRNFANDYLQKLLKINKDVKIVINGAFFNAGQELTHMSFPLKSNGKIINDYMDNDISKRTITIDKNKNAKIYNGYNKSDLNNDDIKELIVGFSPDADANKGQKLGRNYIGVKDNKIYFFIAKDKTQSDMEEIIEKTGLDLNNVLMVDGGPSSQYSSIIENKTYYGTWGVPQFFVVW